MTSDVTRLFPDRDTRFHALVRQQGRLPIDAEENFASDIAEWERDDAFVETIAPSGTPDDGFRITAPLGGANSDFSIGAGSYYLGGARIENPATLSYRGQRARNWLGFPLDAEGVNEAIGGARKFLVWLDAWDQTVTATEDAELKDPGLGGADGVAARRFGWRVRATPVSGPNCVLARTQWLAAQGWTGKVNAGTGALLSGGMLTVTFNPADVDQDLCAPALAPGFLGARNECYRVMASRAGRYVWGRDDAAPVYRVQVTSVGGQMRKLVFLNQPRDEHVRPRQGQTIELLRWDERLPNGQKTAAPNGTFFTAATGLSDGAVTLTSAVDAATLAWLGALPNADLSTEDPVSGQRYFYARLWTGGGRNGQPDNAFADGDLTGTGLQLAFGAATATGDYWVIAARPNAPTQLLPWALKSGIQPSGPRRHVVPLAFVDLDTGSVTDCRRRFRPLYRLGGCCTVTVGDNENSWGDVSTIADAIARLPLTGGEICIGSGVWRENVTLSQKQNITFTGCGSRTHWMAADPALPLVTLFDSHTVKFRRLTMESVDAPCIVNAIGMVPSTDISLEDSRLTTPSGGVIRIVQGQRVTVERCQIESGPMTNPLGANAAFAAVVLHGDGLKLRNCKVQSIGGDTAEKLALGGVQICGGSSDISITDNVILDGAGNGLTLGSIHFVAVPEDGFDKDPDTLLSDAIKKAGDGLGLVGFVVTIDDAGCIRLVDQDPDPTPHEDGTVEIPVSDGIVYRVHIARNRITNCGANGIATFPLLAVNEKGAPAWDAVAVSRVLIEDNEITDNIQREPQPIPTVQRLLSGMAGISLGFAYDLTVRQNRIEGNGFAPKRAASGIFVGYSEGTKIENNRIDRNGAEAPLLGASVGGIVVRIAVGGAELDVLSFDQNDHPALQVQGNIVHAPTGRALKAIAEGPVIVTGNRLTGANQSSLFANPIRSFILLLLGRAKLEDVLVNADAPSVIDLLLFDSALDALGGDAVSLVNLSWIEEMIFVYTLRRKYGSLNNSSTSADVAGIVQQGLSGANFRGGETMFNDNQVSLRSGPADPAGHLSSILIISLDDVSFADNQVEIEPEVGFSLFDTLLFGTTMRATGNRLQEPMLCLTSLISNATSMNTTAHNQGTFAIAASCSLPANLIDTPNTSMI